MGHICKLNSLCGVNNIQRGGISPKAIIADPRAAGKDSADESVTTLTVLSRISGEAEPKDTSVTAATSSGILKC